MKYRKLGKTGLEISEIIFGGGAVGGILINADDDTRRRAVRMALDAGINWIDTAASYGNGLSEKAIAWLVDELPEDDRPYISTKTAFDRDAGDFAGQAERALTASLERLELDSVDLYQVHNRIAGSANTFSGALTSDDMLRSGGIADAMQSLVDKGLTRHIGITSTGEADALHEVIASQRFECAQIYYNLLNPSAGRDMKPNWSAYDHKNIIAACQDNDIGVIATDVRTGKEGGVALDNDVASDEQRMKNILPLLNPEHGERSQVAVRYALRNPAVSGIEVGLAEIRHLKLAIEAAEMGQLPDDLLAKMDDLADDDFNFN
jgi:L-galactose dehydrogenase/L-glyceraldehyde 3-phosphate reductase